MPVANQLRESMKRSSWIREMFEEGARLKAIHGEDQVHDFSLGNPILEPPPQVHLGYQTSGDTQVHLHTLVTPPYFWSQSLVAAVLHPPPFFLCYQNKNRD